MAESAFLAAVAAFLGSRTDLAPAPERVGFAEPTAADELPAVVLSLDESRRAFGGVGERSELMTGALPWREEMNLADLRLAGEPAPDLVSADRLRLTLPHGGLVRSDGSDGSDLSVGPFTAADLRVTLDGAPRVVTAEPGIGRVTFAAPLPLAGTVAAEYFLGQWERSVARLSGVLRVDVCAAAAGDVESLSAGVVEALLSPAARAAVMSAGGRLPFLGLTAWGSVGLPETAAASARRRTARFQFEYEHVVDRPESSGGIIQRIGINAGLRGLSAEDPGVVVFVDEKP